MLHLHLSHRIETLRDRLLGELEGPHDDPLAPQTVIVPSAAMQRWLTLSIADAQGVCARVDFPFLAQWLWLELRRRRGGTTTGLALTPAALAWRVWRVLGESAFVAAHPRLVRYLGMPVRDVVQGFELAERAALALDQVLAYRPQWLQAWSQGRLVALANDAAGDQAWQAALWRRVAEELVLGQQHPLAELAAPASASADAASAAGAAGTDLAPLHVFALPAIAPLQAELLAAAARQREVHVYALNPCREYWFDLVPPQRFARLRSGAAHEVGHPLLTGWGRQTQALIDTLIDRAPDALLQLDETDDDDEDQPAAKQPSLLTQLQRGIRDLQPPTPGSLALADNDRSIELHHCHSLTRELEVLQDRLLGLMVDAEARGDALAPGEIVVVTPDLAAAAPLIHAVFGTASGTRRLPYTVTGLPERQQSAPARVLLALLALLASRATASDVFALLQEPLVARRFGLDDEALAQLHAWLLEAGAHWGLDAEHRAALGVGGDGRHTLADSVERLLLGHLLPDETDAPFAGLLPCGEVEGSRALAVGALAHFSDSLRRLECRLREPHSASGWLALLLTMLDAFVDAGGAAAAHSADPEALQALRAQLAGLAETMALAGLGETPIAPAVLRHALAARLAEPARGGVPSGRVTFAAMASLRHLPYRVVAVIGLNGQGAAGDSAFPRPGGTQGLGDFDLLAAHPQRGDRQRRDDERNLFLDLLLATREHLHLSCTARSVRDNAALAPSVLADELLDTLADGLAPAGADAAERARWRSRLVVEHPLQAFSQRAFAAGGDPRVRSHDADLAAALQGAARATAGAESVAGLEWLADDEEPGDGNTRIAADTDSDSDALEAELASHDPPFFSQPLAPPPVPAEGAARLTLDELGRFLHNPSRQLLRRRLQIVLPREEEVLDDDEPFLLDRSAEQRLADRLLPRLLTHTLDAEALHALAVAGPELPAGVIGHQQLDSWLLELQAFAARVRAARDADAAATLPATTLELKTVVAGQPWLLHATLHELRPHRLARWRFDQLRTRDQVDAWLWHLLLQHAGHSARVLWIARDHTLSFSPVPDAAVHLARLLALYVEGQCEPLPLHLRSAEAFVKSGLADAAKRWRGGDFSWGEADDPARALALRGHHEPLGAAFRAHARTLFEPLREHAQVHPAWELAP